MSAHVILDLLNNWGKKMNCEAAEFNKVNKTMSTNFRFYLSYDICILKDFENASPRLNPLFHKP